MPRPRAVGGTRSGGSASLARRKEAALLQVADQSDIVDAVRANLHEHCQAGSNRSTLKDLFASLQHHLSVLELKRAGLEAATRALHSAGLQSAVSELTVTKEAAARVSENVSKNTDDIIVRLQEASEINEEALEQVDGGMIAARGDDTRLGARETRAFDEFMALQQLNACPPPPTSASVPPTRTRTGTGVPRST